MQHDLPSFGLIVPTLSIDLLTQFDLLLGLAVLFLPLFGFEFDGFDDIVANEPAPIDCII